MSHSLPLLKGRITLEEALDEEYDVLHELSYPQKRLDFFFYLLEHRQDIEDLVSFHLGVPREACKAAEDFREWIHGSFNACIPVYIDDTARVSINKVFIRFPLPYKVGEKSYSGNAEEKLRCEVATYIWIESNCPDIPVPCLRAFGFPNGQSVRSKLTILTYAEEANSIDLARFSALENAPLFARLSWWFRRVALQLFGYPIPSRYVRRHLPLSIDNGYLIVDCVKDGEMLSQSWESLRHDQRRKANLFTGLSRMMLSLARVQFPRIGSFTIDTNGVLSLTNRPLTCSLQQLENCSIPTNIPRNLTYTTSDAYLSDLLACHDNRIRYMPNSINDTADGQQQLSALTMMRALLRHFTDHSLRNGPFILMLADLHQSNIFVDSDWHITAIIDLEWASVLPIEMQHPPYWLTGASLIDRLVGEELEDSARVHAEFMAIFEKHAEFMAIFEKEEQSVRNGNTLHTQIMRKGWNIGNFWYFSALDCLNGLYSLYMSHIQRIFAPLDDSGPEFDRTVSAYWMPKAEEFIATKLRDKEVYSSQLRERFASELQSLEVNTNATEEDNDVSTEQG